MAKDPNEKKKKSQERLRQLLAHPEYKGHVVKVSKIAKALGMSRTSFYENIGNFTLAQEWLAANQDAPMDAKIHYKHMLEQSIRDVETDVHIAIGKGKAAKKLFVPKEVAKIKVQMAEDMVKKSVPSVSKTGGTRLLSATAVSIKQVTTEVQTVEVSEKDAIIYKIRDKFVLAPVGDHPNVRRIMEDFGLLDSNGEPLTELTEAEVRDVMIREDWKEERKQYLYKTQDYIIEEVKMVSTIRNLEMQKMLYNEGRVLHRLNMQFYNTGNVRSLDGKAEFQNFQPDTGQLAGVAEVMRRMVDGGGSVNILINQFGGEKGAANSGGQISLISRSYLSKLATMTPEQLEEESRRMTELASMLERDSNSSKIEEIEQQNEIVDVQKTTQNE